MQDSSEYDQGKDPWGDPKTVQHRERLHAGGGGQLFLFLFYDQSA